MTYSIPILLSPSKTKFAQNQRNLALLKLFQNLDQESFLIRQSDYKIYLSKSGNNLRNKGNILSILNLKKNEPELLKKDEEKSRENDQFLGKEEIRDEIAKEETQQYFVAIGGKEKNERKRDEDKTKSTFVLGKINMSHSLNQQLNLGEGNKEKPTNRENKRSKAYFQLRGYKRKIEEAGRVGEGFKEEEETAKRKMRRIGVAFKSKRLNCTDVYFSEVKGKKLNFGNDEDRKELVDYFQNKEEIKSGILPKIRSHNSFQKSEKKAASIKKENSSSSFSINRSVVVKRDEKGTTKREEKEKKQNGMKNEDGFHIDSFEVKGEGWHEGEEDFLKYVNRVKIIN
jgi:hypothetical protein